MDETEFDDFYLASLGRVTAQVYAMTGDWDEAQDCAQEAFARAWSHRNKLDIAQHPEAWVRTTAHRLAISRWRKVVHRRRPPDRATAPPVVADPPDGRRIDLIRALQQIPTEQRRAVVLHHLLDLPVAEIARETGTPEGTVKARLSRGRTALATSLAETATSRGQEERP